MPPARSYDAMIAAVAVAYVKPLYTGNPSDGAATWWTLVHEHHHGEPTPRRRRPPQPA